jgi:Helix-turn-helix.
MMGHELRRRRLKLGVSQLRLSAVIGVPLETLVRWEEQRVPIPSEYLAVLESTFEAFERDLLSRFVWSEASEAKIN